MRRNINFGTQQRIGAIVREILPIVREICLESRSIVGMGRSIGHGSAWAL